MDNGNWSPNFVLADLALFVKWTFPTTRSLPMPLNHIESQYPGAYRYMREEDLYCAETKVLLWPQDTPRLSIGRHEVKTE